MDKNVDRWWALLIVLALATLTTRGASFYVAADGRPENDGARARPWPSVQYAPAQVGGGHTIVLQPGEYRGPVTVTDKDAGTEKSPTIIKSEKKWQAVIAAGRLNSHGMGNNQDCPWVVFDGFEVFGAADGISLNGDHSVARNCWVHNNWAMGISSHGTKGAVIENCLIEYNGQHPHLHHGVYADSAGEVWIDDLTINGRRFDFSDDPKWDEHNNRRTYETKDTRPRFDFGWSQTHWGSGKVSMIRGVTDSTASIGFYHSTWSRAPRQSEPLSTASAFARLGSTVTA